MKESDEREMSVSLKEHFESRLIAVEKATILAANQLEKRLEGMNEFRSALKDQTTQFLTRKEFDIQHDRVNNDIRSLCETRAEMTGKASMKSVVIGYIISITGFIMGLAAILIEVLRN